MPSQFQNALAALRQKNTSKINTQYGVTGEAKLRLVRPRSQFNLAKEALRSESPVSFNEKYAYSPQNGRGRGRKTRRKSKKSKKSRKRKA